MWRSQPPRRAPQAACRPSAINPYFEGVLVKRLVFIESGGESMTRVRARASACGNLSQPHFHHNARSPQARGPRAEKFGNVVITSSRPLVVDRERYYLIQACWVTCGRLPTKTNSTNTDVYNRSRRFVIP